MSGGEEIRFGRYRLDPVQGLTCGGREVRITPKSLALLRLLADKAGRVVTKEEAFRAVWPNAVVSDAVLATCIRELRQALKDDARRPRYIETLHRRGYRFLPAVAPTARDRSPAHAAASTSLVGREHALQTLRAALRDAERGERSVVLVTGEPGIGKTALVQAFARELAAHGIRLGSAECVERHGTGEAYQPLLEALTRLAQGSASGEVAAALRRYAPTWLAHLPALQTRAEQRTLDRQIAGATPPRMLRELNDCLDALAAAGPLALCIEDLHWSDLATLDWLAAFARRSQRARVLLLVTYRTQDPVATLSRLQAVACDLRMKGMCREIALDRLDAVAVRDYVLQRFAPVAGARDDLERLAALVHRHTEGNPLFVVNVLGELVSRGVLHEGEGGWEVRQDLGEALPVPEDVRRMIELRVEALGERERTLLEVASLVTGVCSAAAVAAGVGSDDVAAVEQPLRDLARRHWFIRETTPIEWPDGTTALGFEFLHALYRETLRERLSTARRAELHRLIGTRLERAYGERAPEIAADLAWHFDRARDLRRAIRYARHAAETDRRRAANREAEGRLRRALVLLRGLPPGRERDELEVSIRIALGGALMAVRGFGAREVEECFARARQACQALTSDAQTFPVLWGLWLFYLGRGSMGPARELADELVAMTAELDDHGLRLQAHHALWATALSEGDIAAVERHALAGMAIYDAEQHAAMAAGYGDHDPGVCALLFAARAAVVAGRTATAARRADEALALAHSLAHPFTLALAFAFASFVHRERGDVAALRRNAAAGIALAREHDFALMLGWLTALDGWALAQLGSPEQGLEALRAGIAAARSTGSELFQPVLLALLAEVELAANLLDDARRSLRAAKEIAERNGDRLADAEIERLQGEVALEQAAGEGTPPNQAERHLRAAVDVAAAQGAWLLALRAATRLGRWYVASGRSAEARRLLEPLRGRVTEEPALPCVREAEAIVASTG
ncbi:MAG TPA: AAA family ATPase [Gammaproteobacteria bacterium]